MINAQIIENTAELIRQLYFPKKLSRYQALFTFSDPKNAFEFKKNSYERNNDTFQVYEISIEKKYEPEIHKGNMELLHMSRSPLAMNSFLNLYWKGETIEQVPSFWEYLLPFHLVTIGEIIK